MTMHRFGVDRSRVACWALLLLSLALVLWIRLIPLSLPGPQWRYAGADGRERVYLGDFDSYLWLRHARTYLRTGTPCDAVVDGACRDTFTNAPVGARTTYARTLHVAAIAGLHRLITLVTPDHPLPASAYLVPVIVGLLGGVPAFFIARALAGSIAGPFAAVIAGLHPVVLARSIGADNDVWNVVLPLYVAWAVMGALAADRPRRQIIYGLLAGVCVGLQAWTWRGWLFAYTVMIAGVVGVGVLSCVRHVVRQRTLRVWQASDVRRAVLVLAVFYVVAGLSTTLAGAEDPYLSIPAKALWTARHSVIAESPEHAAWPSALTRVAELVPLPGWAMAHTMGGVVIFLGSLLGLLLLLLPKGPWRWRHRAIFVGGAALYAGSLALMEPSRTVALALLGVPLGLALIGRWCLDEDGDDVHRGAALLVVLWFLAAVSTAHGGLRFLVLLAPPFGIACAVAAGRLYDGVLRLARGTPSWYRATVYVALAVVLTLMLVHPLRWSHVAAKNYKPSMHDGWWDALTRIRDTARPDAIVHTWWDYGHWIKYVAERPVSNDGSSLLTHIPYWVSRALVAPSEAESVGVLRMLSCGSDATPSPEGAWGAYGKLRSTGRDSAAAHTILVSLVSLDAAAAEKSLEGHGFGPAERAGILRSTHCDPSEGYLLLTSRLVPKRRTWMAFGLWDPLRGRGAAPSPGFAAEEPETGPAQFPFLPRWLPCRSSPETKGMVCGIQTPMGPGARFLHAFTYDASAPRDARLRRRQGERDAPSDGSPAVVIVAGARERREVAFASPTDPDLGVLIDVTNQRILVGSPPLLRSTFVHLMYLDGRYATRYEKFDERRAADERVVTWRIDWNGR